VYGIVGILALKLAVESRGKATNQQGALTTIADEPFGKALLVAMAIGLAGYAIWRLVRAGTGHGTQQKDSGFDRVSGLASCVAYARLCVTAVKILTGASSSGASNSPKQTTGGVLAWTGGTVIVAVTGAILIGVALYQGYKGVSQKFLDDSNTGQMSREVKRGFIGIGVYGTWHEWSFSASSATASSRRRLTTTRNRRSASTEPSSGCPTTPMVCSCWASSPPG
jgi:Domain of Unknown Function (DUF1206)